MIINRQRFITLLTTAAAVSCSAFAADPQPAPPPATYLVSNCVKGNPGKARELRQFMNTAVTKLAQSRASEGRMQGWSMLRAIVPAGAESRCDYLITATYSKVPAEPGNANLDQDLKKAGLAMTAGQFYAERDQLSHLVATEIWQRREMVGRAQKGHYVQLNFMKAPDGPAYLKFEHDVWRPMAELMVQQGKLSGWLVNSRVQPNGSALPYNFVTGDAYPSWEAAFAATGIRDIFGKVHPGRNVEETFETAGKLRDRVRQQLFVIDELIAVSGK